MTVSQRMPQLAIALAPALVTSALIGSFAAEVSADTIELEGIIRDFQICHPDMENPQKAFGHRRGIVQNELGADGLPMLNSSFDPAKAMITSPDSFSQWFRDVPGVNITMPFTITLDNNQDEPGGVYTFARERGMPGDLQYFFPADGLGWNEKFTGADGKQHNFYFTVEFRTEFTYTDPADRDDPMMFRFVGDDDVWVFINGQLAVDIGGVHAQVGESINLDDYATSLGIEPGGTYELALFFAERHRSQSNFRIETSLTLESAPIATMISPMFD